MIDLLVTPVIAVALALITEAVKGAVPQEYHRYIPAALVVVGPAVGVGLSLVLGNTWQQGIVEGVIGAAGAVYGYEFVMNVIRGSKREPDEEE